jgi:hypothetical protein
MPGMQRDVRTRGRPASSLAPLHSRDPDHRLSTHLQRHANVLKHVVERAAAHVHELDVVVTDARQLPAVQHQCSHGIRGDITEEERDWRPGHSIGTTS